VHPKRNISLSSSISLNRNIARNQRLKPALHGKVHRLVGMCALHLGCRGRSPATKASRIVRRPMHLLPSCHLCRLQRPIMRRALSMSHKIVAPNPTTNSRLTNNQITNNQAIKRPSQVRAS
jgi:hypothetical protein